MNAIILAILSAVILGLNAVIIRKGVHRRPTSLNAFIVFVVAGILMWMLVFIVKSPMPSREATFFFMIAGIFAPGFASLFNFESIKRIRATLTSSLVSTSPLFGTALAIIFLGERINIQIALGTLSIVLGVIMISWFRPKKHVKLTDFSFALGGAILVAISIVIMKAGFSISNLPYSAIAISTTSGVIVHFIIITIFKKWHTLSKTFNDIKYFIVAGFLIATAIAILFTALSVADVSIILPLMQTSTLFAILFSWMLLRKHEPLTKHIVFGAVAIVMGAFLVMVGA
tara:strand:+ start:6532 stop:7389 length:858 start_codon:yes stop_codon:yes gene_type:complete